MIKMDVLKEDIEAFKLEQEAWKEVQKIKFEAEERSVTVKFKISIKNPI